MVDRCGSVLVIVATAVIVIIVVRMKVASGSAVDKGCRKLANHC